MTTPSEVKTDARNLVRFSVSLSNHPTRILASFIVCLGSFKAMQVSFFFTALIVSITFFELVFFVLLIWAKLPFSE